MRLKLSAALLLAASVVLAQPPTAESQDWLTVTNPPQVDFTGLTVKQKAAALKSLHVENCVCGCNMKVAQCRVQDPACGDSKIIAGMIVDGIKANKTADQIHDSLINS